MGCAGSSTIAVVPVDYEAAAVFREINAKPEAELTLLEKNFKSLYQFPGLCAGPFILKFVDEYTSIRDEKASLNALTGYDERMKSTFAKAHNAAYRYSWSTMKEEERNKFRLFSVVIILKNKVISEHTYEMIQIFKIHETF